MSPKKKLAPGEKGGFIPGPPWSVRHCIVWKEIGLSELGLLIFMRSKWNGKTPDFKFSYTDVRAHPAKVARLLFRLIRFGFIEKVDAGGLSLTEGSKYRAARYRMSSKWAKYDPAKPGQFIKESPHIRAEWKHCFNADATWATGYDHRHAPGRKRNGIEK